MLPVLKARSPEGIPVGACYGYTLSMVKIIKEWNYDHVAFCFDSGSMHRLSVNPEYKKNRPKLDQDLRSQFKLVEEATTAFNVPYVRAVGWEADDCIATLTKQALANDHTVTVFSQDKDMYQLIGDNVKMFNFADEKWIDKFSVEEQMKVPPSQVPSLLALLGDSTDNIKRIDHLSEGEARLLLKHYGSVEGILKDISSIPQDALRAVITRGKEQLKTAIDQTTLRTDAPVPDLLTTLAYKPPEPEKVMSFLNKLQFKSVIKQLETADFFNIMSKAEKSKRPPGLSPIKPASKAKPKKTTETADIEKGSTETTSEEPKKATRTRRKVQPESKV